MKQSRLVKALSQFLAKRCNFEAPLLLGLSGGPDSLALFYLLLEVQQTHSLNFSVAHVDHGWRPESGMEADQLKLLAAQKQIPFHLKKLMPAQLNGNLEAACRQERLNFFRSLSQQHGYQAVILGHHADDKAENVLKKLLESSALVKLDALSSEVEMDDLKIWRPLLEFTKQDLLDQLSNMNLEGFNDSTNQDCKFLRARLRQNIFPYLHVHFGKEVKPNLLRLAQESQEIRQYLLEKIDPCMRKLERSSNGILLNLEKEPPLSLVEAKMLLREVAALEKMHLSEAQIKQAATIFLENTGNKKFKTAEKNLYIDRKRIFIGNDLQPRCFPLEKLAPGNFGPWTVSMKPVANHATGLTGWHAVWSGKVEVILPEASYAIGSAPLTVPFPGNNKSIDKWWTNTKVPAFLRDEIPVIWSGERIVHEFLSGRQFALESSAWIQITFTKR